MKIQRHKTSLLAMLLVAIVTGCFGYSADDLKVTLSGSAVWYDNQGNPNEVDLSKCSLVNNDVSNESCEDQSTASTLDVFTVAECGDITLSVAYNVESPYPPNMISSVRIESENRWKECGDEYLILGVEDRDIKRFEGPNVKANSYAPPWVLEASSITGAPGIPRSTCVTVDMLFKVEER